MAKFRCKVSGGIMEFDNEYDIEQVRMQEDYEEIPEEEEKPKTPAKTTRTSKPKED